MPASVDGLTGKGETARAPFRYDGTAIVANLFARSSTARTHALVSFFGLPIPMGLRARSMDLIELQLQCNADR